MPYFLLLFLVVIDLGLFKPILIPFYGIYLIPILNYLNKFHQFRIRKNPELHPIIASLDCHHDGTIQVAKDFGSKIQTIIEVGMVFYSSKNEII